MTTPTKRNGTAELATVKRERYRRRLTGVVEELPKVGQEQHLGCAGLSWSHWRSVRQLIGFRSRVRAADDDDPQ